MPILALACLVIALDQLVKYYVQSHMTVGMSIPVIPEVFHITYILNPGAAFGILQHRTWIFVAVTGLLFIAILYYYPRLPKNRLLHWGLGLLVGGAGGNLIDRVQTGYVVDLFDFRIWPIFNIADIAIDCGVALVIYTLLFLEQKKGEGSGK